MADGNAVDGISEGKDVGGYDGEKDGMGEEGEGDEGDSFVTMPPSSFALAWLAL